MGNYNLVKRELKNYLIARTPLVIIDSSERERVEIMLKEISSELSINIGYYTDSRQVTMINGSESQDVNSDPLNYISGKFKKNRHLIFCLGDIRRISEDNLYSRELLNILYLAKEHQCTLILITSDQVWIRLTQFGMITKLDYPDITERTHQINNFVNQFKSRYNISWNEEDISVAATLMRGFSEIQIDNILSNEIVTRNSLDRDHLFELTSQKSKLYSSVPCIQLIKVDRHLNVSGLVNLKEWLQSKKKVFFATDLELDARSLAAPKGVLLAGIPGCGKSLSAKMIAIEWNLPLFRFDIGSVYDKWVGESEKKMKDALDFIDNVSPCVVWIDEIEKALSVSNASNDIGKRVLGQFLFWLQESKSRVFLSATANDIDLLPFELFRKGRFSEIFFLDVPNDVERKDAIVFYCKTSLHINLDKDEIETLVKISEGFSYSDIEYAIKDIAQIALLEGQQIVTLDRIMDGFQNTVPITKSNPDMVKKIRTWGNESAVPASK